jgi:rhamnose transport system ATP-binding protein
MGYASEDRKRFGLVLPMTVRENITMTIHTAILNRLGLISAAKENVVTDRYIEKLGIMVSSREQITRNLSGGNQQKVVIAKWLAIQPLVLILDEPTRGIDVGAKAEVHKIIADLADKGVAVIVISSELPEVLRLADRILVMRRPRRSRPPSGRGNRAIHHEGCGFLSSVQFNEMHRRTGEVRLLQSRCPFGIG